MTDKSLVRQLVGPAFDVDGVSMLRRYVCSACGWDWWESSPQGCRCDAPQLHVETTVSFVSIVRDESRSPEEMALITAVRERAPDTYLGRQR